MFHVYTEKNHSEFTRTLIGEYKDFDKALELEKKAITNKQEMSYIIEESGGHFDSYGNLITEVVEESE